MYTTKADGSQGIGIFGRIGFGDRNTNILEQFYSFGIGGRGMLPGRDRDRFGIGFYYTNFSNHLPEIVLSGDEIGLEVFYNIAATNWLFVTPDIQVIEPAGKRARRLPDRATATDALLVLWCGGKPTVPWTPQCREQPCDLEENVGTNAP